MPTSLVGDTIRFKAFVSLYIHLVSVKVIVPSSLVGDTIRFKALVSLYIHLVSG